ncbi:DNA topoisomerase-1 [Persephonella hydrogeniphila]|uniref:DNA topoisomerase 1 n=1 Tax=Persephonella hydrogeniphila TaxID=198703 RepID=A0A285NBL6_9AQUI|nr:type I DNA topoisomerase [Persephonella hydrogeniphila]SNZ06327.1 DNA topoisomerase-1 [Persephonella hydrogeniphila]
MGEKTKKIVIVESPKKAREIQKFLGKDFSVKATVGHFKDLPEKEMGVDLKSFKPKFVIKSPNHKKMLSQIKKLAENAEVYIATDPDREGYAIGYFMYDELKKKAKEIKRAEFHEITPKHIKEVIKKAPKFEETNFGLFDAFLGRRVGDRIVGYILSPIASKEIGGRFSVGRVQSPAVRLVVEREREIQSFKPTPYYVLSATLKKDNIEFLSFYEKQRIEDQELAQKIYNDIKDETTATVIDIQKKQVKQSPKPPFTTSVLQQTANSQLRFSPEKTMMLAQDLFENGLITYHRTDSVRISDEAIKKIRDFIKKEFGNDYLPPRAKKYKSKNTQADAHEAIRITNFVSLEEQKKLLQEKGLSEDHFKLLKLIYQRTIASQMKEAVYERTTAFFDIKGYRFKTTGSVLVFDGYKKVYNIEDKEETQKIPPLKKGETVQKVDQKLEEKWTKPPPRYTEGSLVKKLEELGIGRPSTYATIMKTIKDRGYVVKEGNALKPTEAAYELIDYLDKKYNWVVDYDFTKRMEEFLDYVEQKKKNWKEFVKQLYEKTQSSTKSVISKKMLDYALDLAKKHGKDISDIIDNPEKLKQFIDQHKETKPTDKQIAYARSLSEKTGLELPEDVLQDKEKIKKWINKAKKEAMKNYQLSEKQKAVLIKNGKEELISQPEKALKWLNSYFRKRRKK